MALRKTLVAYAFLGPILVFFLTFLVAPAVWLLYLSFQHDGILAPARFAATKAWSRCAARSPG